VSFSVGIFAVSQIWFSGLRDIGTFLGLFSAGLAIALRDIVASFAGWLYCLLRRPFEVGDRIQIGDQAGDVVDIRLFRFSLMEIGNWVEADQSTGRFLHIPNSRILTDVIANYTKGFEYIWNELPVLVTFESNWKKAKEILQEIADKRSTHLTEAAKRSVREAAKRHMILYSVLTPKVYTKVVDSGVLLTIRYLCNPRNRRSTEESIWEDILRGFGNREDIDFAYPTIRHYLNPEEGKAAAGGPKPQPGSSIEEPIGTGN
jgi:small-conductance mechanosensitive channel